MKSPEEYGAFVDAQRLGQRRISDFKKQYEEAVANFNQRVADEERELEAVTRQYLEVGVAVLTESLHRSSILKDGAKEYFKQLARGLGRPFVFADHSTSGRWVDTTTYKQDTTYTLHVPHTQRCKNLVSVLTLIAANAIDATADTPVIAFHTNSHWKYEFRGEEGDKLFKSYLDQCVTNPVMRITLKV